MTGLADFFRRQKYFGLLHWFTRSFPEESLYWQKFGNALSKGTLTNSLRSVDETLPDTWEFSAFSQNGEDGIIDYLVSRLITSNRTFLEIGASDGLQNNTTFLAIARGFTGVMIDGNEKKIRKAEKYISTQNWGVRFENVFVTKKSAGGIVDYFESQEIDFLSLDIDSNDYYVCNELLKNGLKPSIICVEYNSAFGPDKAVTIPYQEQFDYLKAHPYGIYYGVSLNGWRRYLEGAGYRFINTDMHGVNAFFVQPEAFEKEFLDSLVIGGFRENHAQKNKAGGGWRHQTKLLEGMPLRKIK